MKEKHAYLFFNCDEEKSQQSMNIFYNRTVYQDTKKARRALLAKVEEEFAAGRIRIKPGSLDAIEKEIVDGSPTKAAESIEFANIVELSII